MAISAKNAEQIIRLLKEKVIAGTLDRETAENLAVLAVQEIMPDSATGADEAPVEEAPVEEPAAPATPPGSLDPSSDLMKLIADFDAQVNQAWNTTKISIDDLLKGLEGAAFPIGDFSSKSSTADKGNATKLTVKKGTKPSTADLMFSFDRSWELDGVTMPSGVQASTEETACHLGLRKELLALTQDVLDLAESELSWKRARLPEKTVAFLTKESAKENDTRVFEIMKDAPNDKDIGGWKKWSIAAQVYILGSDFSEKQTFATIKAGIKE